MSENHFENTRDYSRNLLRFTWFDSFKGSLSFLVGAAGICSLIGGGYIALHQFSIGILFLLIMICLLFWMFSYLVLEDMRLRKVSSAFREFLDIQKTYDLLLEDARRERDRISQDMVRLTIELESVRAAASIVGAVSRKDLNFSPASVEQKDSENGK